MNSSILKDLIVPSDVVNSMIKILYRFKLKHQASGIIFRFTITISNILIISSKKDCGST